MIQYLQMGYKVGQGLGRHGEGIINPVKASKQTDFDRQGPQHNVRAAVAVEDEEEKEEERQFQLQLQQWRINEVRECLCTHLLDEMMFRLVLHMAFTVFVDRSPTCFVVSSQCAAV